MNFIHEAIEKIRLPKGEHPQILRIAQNKTADFVIFAKKF